MTIRSAVSLTAGIALCLAAATPARGDATSPVMVVFSRSGSNTPFYATWNGAAWSGASALPSISTNARFVLVANCPLRNETACMTLGADDRLRVQFFNGSAWSSPTQICSNVGTDDTRACAMAYESSSGRLIMAYWVDSANKIGWRTYDGTSLSAESQFSLNSSTRATNLSLTCNPCTNEMILLTQQNNSHLNAVAFDGTSWSPAVTLESNLSWKDEVCASAAFVGRSSIALAAHTRNATWNPQYQTCSGSSWSSRLSAPAFSSTPQWVRLAGHADTGTVLYGSLYRWSGSGNITVNQWDGSAWGTPTTVETNVTAGDKRAFDLAWEPGAGGALMVYQEGTQTSVRYRKWNGSSWGAEQTGANIGNAARFVQLTPGTTSGEVFVAASDAGNDLNLMRWNGTSLSASTQIEGNLGGTSTTEPFMISVPAAANNGCGVKIVSWREVPNPDPLNP